MKRTLDFKLALLIALAFGLIAAAHALSVPAAQQNQNSSQPQPSSAAQQPPPAGQREQTLYQRLGGYDAVAAVVDDFVGRLVGDQRFARFFSGHSNDSKRRIRQHIVDQLCNAAGGPCVYTGRTMRASHEGLGITEEDWEAAGRHLVASLDRFRVPQREREELLAAINALKPDIVEMPRRAP